MRIGRSTAIVVGLWALVVWAISGAVLTWDVLTVSRAVDVIAASPICPPACPTDATPSWVAAAVMSGWVLIAIASAVGLAVIVGRRVTRSEDR